MLKLEVQMKSNIEKLRDLRNLAILSKSPMQFGLTSLLLRLEYGNDLEMKSETTAQKDEELTL